MKAGGKRGTGVEVRALGCQRSKRHQIGIKEKKKVLETKKALGKGGLDCRASKGASRSSPPQRSKGRGVPKKKGGTNEVKQRRMRDYKWKRVRDLKSR